MQEQHWLGWFEKFIKISKKPEKGQIQTIEGIKSATGGEERSRRSPLTLFRAMRSWRVVMKKSTYGSNNSTTHILVLFFFKTPLRLQSNSRVQHRPHTKHLARRCYGGYGGCVRFAPQGAELHSKIRARHGETCIHCCRTLTQPADKKGNRVFAMYQIRLGWKAYRYYYETDKLPHPWRTQPRTN